MNERITTKVRKSLYPNVKGMFSLHPYDLLSVARLNKGLFVVITFSGLKRLAVDLSTFEFHANKAPLNIHTSIKSGAAGLPVSTRVAK